MNEATNYKLKMLLTEADRKKCGKRGYNPYALGIMFQAAEGVDSLALFCQRFNACREMHAIAKKMGWIVEVERGEWVIPAAI